MPTYLFSICVLLVINVHSLQSLHVSSALAKNLKKAVATSLIVATLPFSTSAAEQQDYIKSKPIYFGAGCFWHVQHEFVDAEKSIMNRNNNELTAIAGYAGGKKEGSKGEVCYHNMQGVAEYGSLGHTEVVGLNIPDEKFSDFAKVYFSLFGSDLERPDKGDRGPEYRSVVGLPGGKDSKLFSQLQNVANEKGMKLEEGLGDDSDTLFKKKVWVLDSEKFPFHQAEVYHQFHDGFMPGEQYPQIYNDLRKESLGNGIIVKTMCPDNLF